MSTKTFFAKSPHMWLGIGHIFRAGQAYSTDEASHAAIYYCLRIAAQGAPETIGSNSSVSKVHLGRIHGNHADIVERSGLENGEAIRGEIALDPSARSVALRTATG